MYGSQWNSCTVDGDYAIVDLSTGIILASTIAANSDYGNQEINNFCFTGPSLVFDINYSYGYMLW